MEIITRAILSGVAVLLAGTIPRNLLFAANLRIWPAMPWAVPVMAAYLWLFWRYLDGTGAPASNAAWRRESLRARPLAARVWMLALAGGLLGIVTLVIALRVANRVVSLPPQQLPDLGAVPAVTIASLLLMGALVAGVVEEAAFRGYMQGPIERQSGIVPAILITGTMFGLVHLDFTWILWPYYLAVAALYGIVTYLTDSIGPAIVLHTAGNVFSNLDLWLHGQAEWQAPAGGARSVWATGPDAALWTAIVSLLLLGVATVLVFRRLASTTSSSRADVPRTGRAVPPGPQPLA